MPTFFNQSCSLCTSCGLSLVPFNARILASFSICNINFDMFSPCYWFVSMSCWHNSTIASFVVAICCMCFWSNFDVSPNSSNMSLIVSSETMFFSLTFCTLSNLYYSPVAFLYRFYFALSSFKYNFQVSHIFLCPHFPPSSSYFSLQTVDCNTFHRPPVWFFISHPS